MTLRDTLLPSNSTRVCLRKQAASGLEPMLFQNLFCNDADTFIRGHSDSCLEKRGSRW